MADSRDARSPAAPDQAPTGEGRGHLLRAGRGAHADLLLVETDAGPCVMKDFSGRPAWLRRTWGRFICAREQAAYRALDARLGPADEGGWRPRFVGARGPDAFVLSYRPGRPVSRAIAGELPPTFYGELEGAVRAMHAAGVVHLDLSHRSNVLVDEAGAPVMLDFASAMTAPPGSWRHRLLLLVFGAIDRRALRKWRRKLAVD